MEDFNASICAFNISQIQMMESDTAQYRRLAVRIERMTIGERVKEGEEERFDMA